MALTSHSLWLNGRPVRLQAFPLCRPHRDPLHQARPPPPSSRRAPSLVSLARSGTSSSRMANRLDSSTATRRGSTLRLRPLIGHARTQDAALRLAHSPGRPRSSVTTVGCVCVWPSCLASWSDNGEGRLSTGPCRSSSTSRRRAGAPSMWTQQRFCGTSSLWGGEEARCAFTMVALEKACALLVVLA